MTDSHRADNVGPIQPLPPLVEARDARATTEALVFEVRRVIVGQDAMLERVLVALLAGGHLLLEGVPGLAKTLTIKTLASARRHRAAGRWRQHHRQGGPDPGGGRRRQPGRAGVHHRTRHGRRDRGAGGQPRTQAADPRTARHRDARPSGRADRRPLLRGAHPEGPAAIYENVGSRVGTTEETQEVTVFFASGGLVLMVVGAALAALWFNRFP